MRLKDADEMVNSVALIRLLGSSLLLLRNVRPDTETFTVASRNGILCRNRIYTKARFLREKSILLIKPHSHWTAVANNSRGEISKMSQSVKA